MELKRFFLILHFYKELSRFKVGVDDIPLFFIHIFRIFDQFIVNFAKIC